MRRCVGTICLAGLLVLGIRAAGPAPQSAGPKLRVGTFDSRAIALASAKPVFAQQVQDLMAKHEKAKADKNETLAAELQAEGEARQLLMHMQGFSTASVMSILDPFKSELPKLAEKAGVDLIVSEWDVACKTANVEAVDVTMSLVELFQPDEETLKMIDRLRTQPPMPLPQLLKSSRLREKQNK